MPRRDSVHVPAGRLIKSPPPRSRTGVTWITRERSSSHDRLRSFMDFGLLRLKTNESHRPRVDRETVFVLMHGSAVVEVADAPAVHVQRRSLFDEAPTALQCGSGTTLTFTSQSADNEWAVLRAAGSRLRGVRWYMPGQIASEDRGAGLAQDACRRTVRTLFDYESCSDSGLVVGEVVNRAGRWSSYPPHHHPQPELYHYRFTAPPGYGHAELGERVLKIRAGDTTEIPGGLDHAQVAAPGYGMYYLWAVRHLPRRPYRGFEFSAAHTWLLDPRQQGWAPQTPAVPAR